MTCGIGKELNTVTGVLSFSPQTSSNLAVMDLCMAPGGFTTAALTHNPSAHVRAISLPVENGGHEIRFPNWQNDNRIMVKLLDITMLAAEMGVDIDTEIPASHPDAGRFLPDRPFEGDEFDLIFCGGTLLRTHQRPEYRQHCEGTRLQTSQLVLAMGRVRQGGTLVVVLHRADTWSSASLMHVFCKFAEVKLFKPTKAHTKRSSFYMVARNVQSQNPDALRAVETWKKEWRVATLGGMTGQGPQEPLDEPLDEPPDAEKFLTEFGKRLAQLSAPVFKIQADALRKAPWTTGGRGGRGGRGWRHSAPANVGQRWT